jgi:hypothetical protein
MGIHQLAKVNLQLIRAQPIRAAIEMTGNPSNSTRINVDGLTAFALQLQHSQMAEVQIVKAGLFRCIHDKLL